MLFCSWRLSISAGVLLSSLCKRILGFVSRGNGFVKLFPVDGPHFTRRRTGLAQFGSGALQRLLQLVDFVVEPAALGARPVSLLFELFLQAGFLLAGLSKLDRKLVMGVFNRLDAGDLLGLDQRDLVAWIIPKDVLSLCFSTPGIT